MPGLSRILSQISPRMIISQRLLFVQFHLNYLFFQYLCLCFCPGNTTFSLPFCFLVCLELCKLQLMVNDFGSMESSAFAAFSVSRPIAPTQLDARGPTFHRLQKLTFLSIALQYQRLLLTPYSLLVPQVHQHLPMPK